MAAPGWLPEAALPAGSDKAGMPRRGRSDLKQLEPSVQWPARALLVACRRLRQPAARNLRGSSRLLSRFRDVGGDRVHQRRRQAIIGLEPEFRQARSDPRHLRWCDAGLDNRRHERREPRCCRAGFLEQFGVDEVETIEGMPLVLNSRSEAMHCSSATSILSATNPIRRRGSPRILFSIRMRRIRSTRRSTTRRGNR